jgi:uncharacterized FlaG/YvyC family protein
MVVRVKIRTSTSHNQVAGRLIKINLPLSKGRCKVATSKNTPPSFEELTAKKNVESPKESPTRSGGDSEADKEAGKSGYIKPEDAPHPLGDNTSTTRAPETIEADKANREELQAVADRQEQIDKELEKENKRSKLHKVTDIGHDRVLIITNDTDKALEEIDKAPYNVDVINNGANVWTGDLTDRVTNDLIAENKVVASKVKQKND